MKGSVTISLDDFQKLQQDSELGGKLQKEAVELAGEVDRLLTFMHSTMDMREVAKNYNQLPGNIAELQVQDEICRLRKKTASGSR